MVWFKIFTSRTTLVLVLPTQVSIFISDSLAIWLNLSKPSAFAETIRKRMIPLFEIDTLITWIVREHFRTRTKGYLCYKQRKETHIQRRLVIL